MILWIITGVVFFAFCGLGLISQIYSSSKLPGFGHSAKDQAIITNAIKKSIRKNTPPSDLEIGSLNNYFESKHQGYIILKDMFYTLVNHGYKIGDSYWDKQLEYGRGFLFYIYSPESENITYASQSIGSIFICENDIDFEKFSSPQIKRDELIMSGLCIVNKTLCISAHTSLKNKENIPDWLNICNKILSEIKTDLPSWAEKHGEVII